MAAACLAGWNQASKSGLHLGTETGEAMTPAELTLHVERELAKHGVMDVPRVNVKEEMMELARLADIREADGELVLEWVRYETWPSLQERRENGDEGVE